MTPAGAGRPAAGPPGAPPDWRTEPGEAAEAAPAKLNLTLHVVGRRADGFHLLDGLVAFAALGDRVTVRRGPVGAGPRLRLTGPFAAALQRGAAADNLAVRAALGLGAALGRPADVELSLDKHLPVASGIGGGSADAAAALRALARLWGVAADHLADHPALAQTAAGLGADVPVCLAGGTAWIAGIGEVDAPGPDLAGVPVVLVNPGVALPTPDVFRARRGPFSAPDRFDLPPGGDARRRAEALAAALARRGNDLTEAAIERAPAVAAALDRLNGAPGCLLARMSGSGATCFGLFATADGAEAAAAALAGAEPGWWVRATALL